MVSRLSLSWAAIAFALIVWGDARECAAQYGPPSWAGSTLRGRYHYYNGPTVSYGRGRWGGGISNNGALVLNNLVSTAGAVAPVILPMLMPGIATESSQLQSGSGGENASAENAFDSEPIDPNRDARDAKLTDIEERTGRILERLKIDKPTSLFATSPGAYQAGANPGQDPSGKPITRGKKP